MIVAAAENDAIGKDNDLIWRLPEDLKFFRNTTMGHVVVMGRKNFESIPDKWRPLDGRENIVITSQEDYEAPGCVVVQELGTALDYAREKGEEECFVIGGGQIYKLALEMDVVDKLYITRVHESFDADVFFPEWDESNWELKGEIHHPADEKHPHSFTYFEYIRKR
ncbi:MAG: dihydrofolate reductase [Flavobacteriales bacterium]|nr:dihydrofolate reductase [Flavobacteriales bacterium]